MARAANWAALLDDADVNRQVREACERWCSQDPRHRVALDRMRGLAARFDRLDGMERETLTVAAARRARPDHRSAIAALAMLVLVVAGGWRLAPLLVPLFPDHRTDAGQRRNVALADGSELVLDGNSAVDVDLSATVRRITLFQGQVQATVTADATRPFTVTTADGTATALGTAYIVRKQAEGTRITVVESRVQVCANAQVAGCLDLAAGQRALITPTGVQRLSDVDPRAAAGWVRGWLEADDMPLPELLSELNRQRQRPIRFDPASLAGRRVTGSFPLDDTDRAVQALAAATGLRLYRAPDGDMVLSTSR
ncbi:FecR family protein [Niveispirillum sp. KHB5.9]|uniref:FecR family protein n=1 Tax=Niveispirillum sp. KHB5.9 TaxID=3400269 RepID=UPI003A86A52A